MLRNAGSKTKFAVGGVRRLAHSLAQPAPLGTAINHQINNTLVPCVLPENNDDDNRNPNSPFFGGAMELMAVPKKKTTPHKRGIRNGPKALKPVPVIIRCNFGACNLQPSPQFPVRNLNSLSAETEAEFIERLHSGSRGRPESDTPVEQEWNVPPQSAEEIFTKMKETGLIPNAVAMLDALCNDGLGDEALKLIVLVRDEGMIPRVVIHTAAVEGFCKAHRFDDAIRVFKKMKIYGVHPNAVTYQILIRGLCIGKRLEDAFQYTVEMLESGHSPNAATFTGLLDVYCKEKGLQAAKDLIAGLKLKGFSMELKVIREYWNAKGPFSPLVMEAIMGIKD